MIKNILSIISLSMFSFAAQSALVTWEVKSSITAFTPDMIGYAHIGDVVTLRYTFDTDTPDVSPHRSDRGDYDDAIVASEVFLNEDYASFGSGGYIRVLDNLDSGDLYVANTYGDEFVDEALSSYNGFGFVGYSVGFQDDDGSSLLNSINLMSEPNFGGYDRFSLTLNFRNPPGGAVGYGAALHVDNLISISQISTIPIPSAVWLFGSGLIGLIGLAKRKKH